MASSDQNFMDSEPSTTTTTTIGFQQPQSSCPLNGSMNNPPVFQPSSLTASSLDSLTAASTSSSLSVNDQINKNPFIMAITSFPSENTKPWHLAVEPNLRHHFVRKLLTSTLQNLLLHNPHVIQDYRMTRVIDYFKRIEQGFYEKADSRSEYYHLIAEKIYTSLKYLEDNRRRRLEAQQEQEASAIDNLIGDINQLNIGFEH